MRSVLALGCLATVALGCGPGTAKSSADGGGDGDGDADRAVVPARRICDGSDEIRFAFQVPVGAGRVMAFTQVLWELGAEFLYVDGHCHFWMTEAPGFPQTDNYFRWHPYREGVLTPDQESALHDAAGYDDFAHQAPACMGQLPLDGSPVVVWDGATTHVCNGSLPVDPDWPTRNALAATSTPMAGPMRIEVGQTPLGPDAPIYDWPLSAPPASYEVANADSTSFGHSALITDSTEVAGLRALRDRAIADAVVAPGYFYGIIFVKPAGYAMSLRDDLPFTNRVDGLWSPP